MKTYRIALLIMKIEMESDDENELIFG